MAVHILLSSVHHFSLRLCDASQHGLCLPLHNRYDDIALTAHSLLASLYFVLLSYRLSLVM